jgi:hypothetical protein
VLGQPVNNKLRRMDTTKKVMVDGALEVMEDALHRSKMGLTKIKHMERGEG